MRDETHFGFRDVPLSDKQALVDDVFHKVARRYDLMNDLMSGGLHRAWKDALVTAINPPKSAREFSLLDVAGGTGDVSFRTVEAGGSGTRATVADINAGLPGAGRARPGGGAGGGGGGRVGGRGRGDVRRRERGEPAVSGQKFRRGVDCLRHPQCAAR